MSNAATVERLEDLNIDCFSCFHDFTITITMYVVFVSRLKPRERLHHFSTCSFFSMYRVIGVGWGGWGVMFTFDALAHMFDAT